MLEDETIPHVALFVGAHRSSPMHPGENFLVAAPFKRSLSHVRVRHTQKAAAAAIGNIKLRVAEIRDVSRWKLPRGVESDLIQHAAEINEPPDLGVTTTKTG